MGVYLLRQSSYRKYHSTETALLKVRNDILQSINGQQVILLDLLDYSAAFDTVSQDKLLSCVGSRLGDHRHCSYMVRIIYVVSLAACYC